MHRQVCSGKVSCPLDYPSKFILSLRSNVHDSKVWFLYDFVVVVAFWYFFSLLCCLLLFFFIFFVTIRVVQSFYLNSS